MTPDIKQQAALYTKDEGYQKAYIAGATEYATKYQQAKAFLQTLIHYQDAGIGPT